MLLFGTCCVQFQCIGRGASKVVYKGFDEVEGIEVAWNEVACSDWVLGRYELRRHTMLGPGCATLR